MRNHWVLTGKIVSGVQEAAYFTQLDWVQEQCMEKLGFRPYSGTLNLEISEESFPIIEALQEEEGVKLIPPDPRFCSGKAFPASVGATCGAIIIPAEDVRVHRNTIVELMAPVRLKEALEVDDGDSITVVVKRPEAQST